MGLSLLATTDTQIIRVVEALFKQTPGYTYLSNFRTYTTENGIDALANALAGNLSSQTDAELAATVTANLGLTGDALAAGNSYLEGQFAANPAARGKVVLDAMNLLATMESDATFGAVAASYNADIVASLTYSTVTTNTTVLAAGEGQVLAMTTSADALVGGSKNDTVSSLYFADNGTGTTIQAGDSFTGGAGTDTLTISVAGASSAAQTLSAVQTSGVEKVLVSNFDTNTTDSEDHTIDATLMSSIATVGLSSSSATGDTEFSSLQNLVDAEMRSGNGDLTVTYVSTVIAGTTDTQNLTVSGLTGGAFTAAGVETVNITSETIKSTLATLTTAAATSLTITGDKQLTITAALNATNTALKTIDATGATGGVVLLDNSSTVSFTGGAGDDTYKTSTAVAATYAVDGGAGTDTLSVTDSGVLDTALETARYTNFETLQINNASADTATSSQDLGLLSAGITKVIIDSQDTTDTGADDSILTHALTNAASGLQVQVQNLSTAEAATNSDDTLVAVSVAMKAATDTTSDSVDLILGTATADSGANSIRLLAVAQTGVAGETILTFTANTAETINVTSQGAANKLALIDSTSLTTLNFSGDKALTMGGIANATKLATIDASEMTAALVMGTNASTTASTITGSAKDDTLTGGTLADTINGGAGIDRINAAAGDDVIDGGDGADIITSGTGDDTVTGGAGIDDIRFLTADLTLADTVDAGEGVDLLTISDAATLADADFTGVTNVETLEFEAATTSVVLGAEAAEAGIVTIANKDVVTSLTLGATFTNDVTITLDTGANADTIDASAYTGALSLSVDGDDLVTGDTFTAGTGTSDTLTITSETALATGDVSGVSGFETIKFKTDVAGGLTLNDGNTAAGKSLTIDATTMVSSALTLDASLELDGSVIVNGGGVADTITGSASTLGDTLNGNAGNDAFVFASANLTLLDTIDGGAGTIDVIQITDAATVVDADFTNVTNVEKLLIDAAGTVILDTLAVAAGITTVANTTGAGALNLTLKAGYTNDLTVALLTNADTITGTLYTKNLTVTGLDANIDGSDTITGGTGTADTLTVTFAVPDLLDATELGGVTKMEIFKVADNAANAGFTTADGNIASGKSLLIDGTKLVTTNTLTVSGAAETNGALTVQGGNGADDITGTQSSMGDTFYGNGGADTFTFVGANLTALDTVDGGSGTDILTVTGASVLADADFTGITNVETFTGSNAALTMVLGAEAAEAGIKTVNLITGTNVNSITLGAGFTAATTTVALTDNTDTIAAASYTGALTVTVIEDDLTAGDTITGGTGADTLTITFDGDVTDVLTEAEMANVTKIETIKTATNAVGSLALHDNNIAKDGSITINAAKNTSAAFTLDGSAELDGTITYVGGAGIDTVTGGAKNDTIGGGAGADVITGGKGTDALTGGSGADTFTFTAVNHSSGATVDSITDYLTGTDKLAFTLNYSALVSGVTVVADVTTAAAGTSALAATLTGNRGQAVYDTTNSVLNVNVNNDNLMTSLDYQVGIGAASTAANSVVSADINWTVTGTSSADSITTGSGADTIVTGNGGDTVDSGAGIDTVTGGTGADTIDGGTGADTITGGDGVDSLTGGTGNDTFSYDADDSIGVVVAGDDNDTGQDSIVDWASGDLIKITGELATGFSAATDVLVGTATGSKSDASVGAYLKTVYLVDRAGVADGTAFETAINVTTNGSTAAFADSAAASAATVFDVTLAAGGSAVTLGANNDTLVGGTGTDTITGGAGADTLTGAGGADTFTYGDGDSKSAAMDVIVDYTTTTDIIDDGGTITLAANTDASGEATVSAAGLVTGYNGASTAYDTFAEKLTQIDKGLGGTANQAALFTDSEKAYLYISVGTDALNDGTDTVIELTGVTTATGLTETGGNITAIAQ